MTRFLPMNKFRPTKVVVWEIVSFSKVSSSIGIFLKGTQIKQRKPHKRGFSFIVPAIYKTKFHNSNEIWKEKQYIQTKQKSSWVSKSQAFLCTTWYHHWSQQFKQIENCTKDFIYTPTEWSRIRKRCMIYHLLPEGYYTKNLPAIRRSERLSKSSGPCWNASLTIVKACNAVICSICSLPPLHHLMEGLAAINTQVLLLVIVCRFPLLNHWSKHIHCMSHVWPLAGLSRCAVPCQFSNSGDALECLICHINSWVNGSYKLLLAWLDVPEPLGQVPGFLWPPLI